MTVDASILLPLLVALVPVALFFALVRRRRAAPPQAGRPDPRSSEPAADFGLDRDTDSQAPAPPADTSGSTAAGAAAAAGGALILGYGASHRADSGGDNGPDRADAGSHKD
ncbi:hypothetical protein [Xanthobacter sediminis]